MKYLLDTNIISEIDKTRPDGGVLAWFAAHHSEEMGVPAIAVFAIQMGAERLRREDPVRAAQYADWAARIVGSGSVLSLDAAAAQEAARLLGRLPMEMMADAMIAAIARVNGLTVATRNVKHFAMFGVPLVNPFDFKG